LAGATVLLLQIAGEDRFIRPDAPARREAQSRQDGSFEFPGLPLGTYSVLAHSGSHAQSQVAYLSLEAPIADVDLKLGPSGHVSGVVRDASGQPVEGAEVWALQSPIRSRYGAGRGFTPPGGPESLLQLMPGSQKTAADGVFRFTNLPAVSTRLLAMPSRAAAALSGPVMPSYDGLDILLAPGGVIRGRVVLGGSDEPVAGVTVVANGSFATEHKSVVTSDEGHFEFPALRPAVYEVAVVDERFALAQGAVPQVQIREGEESDPVLVQVVPAATVAGRVLKQDSGDPVAGISVAARSETLRSLVHVETAADGSYSIRGMTPGKHHVFVAEPGLRRLPAVRGAATQATISLAEGQTLTGLDFKVRFGGMVQGQVVDEAGKPAPFADIMISRADGGGIRVEKADAQGLFAITGATPGARLLLRARRMHLVSQEPYPVDVPLDKSSASATLVVSQGARLQGQVLRSSGAPLEQAPVYLNSPRPASVQLEPTQLTGSGGTFAWDGLPGGEYQVGVAVRNRAADVEPPRATVTLAPGEESAPVNLVYDGPVGGDDALEAGETGDLSIRGRVTDPRGNPIPGADVYARSGTGFGHTAQTLHDGTFEIAGIAAGDYSIGALHRDYMSADSQEVRAGEASVALVLQPAGRVSGQVIDAATGQPLQEFEVAEVSARQLEREQPVAYINWQPFFDPDGQFALVMSQSRVERVLMARAEGYAPEQQFIGQVEAGQHLDNLVFRLRPGAVIEGTVHDASGKAIPGASIFQGVDERRSAALARTDTSGAFRVAGLEQGSIDLTASHPSYASATVTLTARLGTVTRADFVLGAGGAVEGYVSRNGQALEGQAVSLNLVNAHQNAMTDATGYYAFRRLPEGEGTVTVSLRGDASGDQRQYLNAERSVIVADGRVTRADFEFSSQDASVEGIVTVEGVPASVAYVSLTVASSGGEQHTGTRIEANGFYRLENLSPGSATLDVSLRTGRDGRNKSLQFELAAGQQLRQDVDFGPVSSVMGTLRGVRSGEQAHIAVISGEVQMERPTLEDVQSLLNLMSGYGDVAADGTFEVENLEPGTYTIVGVAILGEPETELEALANARYVTRVIHVEEGQPLLVNLSL
jgi:protocatechuate 3,4-dioxygenase beta subunit